LGWLDRVIGSSAIVTNSIDLAETNT
jgi:hypothetical protein